MGLGNRGERRELIHKIGLEPMSLQSSPVSFHKYHKDFLRYLYFKELVVEKVISNPRETDYRLKAFA